MIIVDISQNDDFYKKSLMPLNRKAEFLNFVNLTASQIFVSFCIQKYTGGNLEKINTFPKRFDWNEKIMECSYTRKCRSPWECYHRGEHWQNGACKHVIPDKGPCQGAVCQEVKAGKR
jgi:hypothetical protein